MNIQRNMDIEEFEQKIADERISAVYVENFESNLEDSSCSIEVNAFDLNDNLIASHRLNALNDQNLANRVSIFIEEHFHDELLEDAVAYEHDFDE